MADHPCPAPMTVETGPVIHLVAAQGSFTACRRGSKNVTGNAASVTCEECKQTWDYAEAARNHRRRAETVERARRDCPVCQERHNA
jgi:hypothetical protein